MNKINTTLFLSAALTLSCIVLPMNVNAEWSGDIEGGQVLQGDDKGTRVRFNLSNNERPFNQRFYADWVRSEDNDSSYEAGYEPQYWFSDTTYVFGEGSFRTAKAQQIDQQIKLVTGLGIQLINTETTRLFGEIGAGQLTTKYDDTFLGTESSVDTTFTTARIGAEQTVSDLIKLELDGDYLASDDLEQTTAEAGVSLRVAGGAIKYSYRVRSNTVGDLDADNVTDSSVSFNYNF